MGIVSSTKDPGLRRLTVVTDLDATVERVWSLWSDPDRFARWWGPPGLPLIVEHHDLSPGGTVRFHVLIPDGGRVDARLEVADVRPPRGLGFVFHSEGIEPATVDVAIEVLAGDRARMTVVVTFDDDDAMAHALDIGFDVGLTVSIGRVDDGLVDA